ncbi:MAG: chemotaxis-specific protein-glutamate methyltransferase CheB [Sulfurimonas sp.]|nr:chemotaxis-specific protein-glutamate methyltransferase CheB [Sulfurimonas sp.]MBU3937944.1 chemotaxis-specific protein-glutamate methyltransferase CheB [bacterium]MBU4023966.1 chemotaxis-specific protein-glutamate methyltransferase CheB [bacterium]MBU4057919.1 chemotaxis-specific protein-glutamate methyltransferase CheB [bacterium]
MSKRVLLVDDSALVRKQLSEIIATLGFDIDFAKNGQEAVDKATAIQYDVITMDINMPVMDGLEAVKQIMEQQPTPILMVSSLTVEDASITMDALDLGALDYISKPGTMNIGRDENREDILEKVKSLSCISPRRLKRQSSRPLLRERKRTVTFEKDTPTLDSKDITKVVLIGASTGGPGLIEQICASLPSNYKYPVCVVQHMPAQFTSAFAMRLNRASALNVHESAQNMELLPGNIYVARGGVHMNFSKKVSGKVVIREDKVKGEHFFQPSVDEMFYSALEIFNPSNIIGVLLTGIGDDGADGMVKLRKAGAYTLGESERTAVVYGMPKEAYERGGVMEQLDFPQILKKIAILK